MGNEATIRARYRTEDIDALRREIQVGDVITGMVRHDRLGERLVVPVRKKYRVAAKYRYLVELETDGSRRKTATYVDILLGQVE